MLEQPIKGEVVLYDPSYTSTDDNYSYNNNFNGPPGGMGGNPMGGPQGGMGGPPGPGPQGGYSSFGNQGPPQGGRNQAPAGGTSTQVTIPNDMAGAIIGQGGKRIQEIRQKCGAQIKFADPEPGKKDRLITISGSDEQIQYAQYLMQQCVLSNHT